jgi:hypothetical protein
MAAWQIVTLVVFVLLPLLLLADFHPRRERLDARGDPLERGWDRQLEPTVDEPDHH